MGGETSAYVLPKTKASRLMPFLQACWQILTEDLLYHVPARSPSVTKIPRNRTQTRSDVVAPFATTIGARLIQFIFIIPHDPFWDCQHAAYQSATLISRWLGMVFLSVAGLRPAMSRRDCSEEPPGLLQT